MNSANNQSYRRRVAHRAAKIFIGILIGICCIGATLPALAQSIDLVVSQIDAPASGQLGKTISVSNTIKNQGAANATGAFRVGFYLSTDDVITSSDVLIGTRSVNGLSAGSSSDANTVLTIPSSMVPGNYYLGVWADDENNHAESNENNNTAADAMQVLDPAAPDLVITEVDAPASAVAGEQILVYHTVTNQGQRNAGAFEVGIYLSNDNIINGSDKLLTTRSVNSLAVGASNSTNAIVTIPSNTAPGNYYLGAWADYSSQILEANESNNIRTDAITIATPTPDLIISAVSAPPTASPGQTIIVSSTVTNKGTGKAGSFSVGIYLSSDTSITSSDVLLEIRSLNSLSPDFDSSADTPVTIPKTVAPGNYYLGVWADNFQGIEEKNENNNKAVRALAVVAKPDLIITTLATPATTSPGQTFPVSATVKNQGTANAGAFRIGFYLSTDAVITPQGGDVLLGFRTVSQLATDGSSLENATLTIPSSVAVGSYFLGAWVDDQNAIDEAVENNNTKANNTQLIAPSPVDLVVTIADAPAQASLGQNITVKNAVKNQGTAPISGTSFQIGIYLSPDNVITASDFLLGTRVVNGLGVGASDTANTPVTIPANLATGNYFIGVWADHSSVVNEINESNNIATDAITITGLPDLIVTLVDAPTQANPGQSIPIDNTVKNQGNAAANAFQVGIYLSTDSLITTTDILLGARTVNSLAAGVSSIAITNVTLPATVTPGSYFVGVWADYLGALNETNENNNAAFDRLSIIGLADLVVTRVDAPAQVTIGQTFTVANTVANQGAAAASAFQVGIYLSADNVITGADVLLTTRMISALTAGAASTENTAVTIPTAAAAGNYFIGVLADIQNAIIETNENNNAGVDTVRILGPADLIVTAVDAPSQTTPGQSIVIANTVKNQGGVAAGTFQVGFYLSADSVITNTDVFLGTRTVSALAAGATNTANTPVTVPATTTPGNYFIGVWADYFGVVPESNENNNTATKAMTVSNKPDLIVARVDAPPTLTPGQSAMIKNMILNQGSAAGAFQVGIYLSGDNVITANDILLGTRTINSLAAGKSDSANTTVSVPAALAPGNYFVGVWADYAGVINESDENNNIAIAAVAVGGQADLVITMVDAPTQTKAGQSVNVANTVINQGVSAAGTFEVGIYLSTDRVITAADELIGKRTIKGLAVAGKDSATTAVTIPFNTTPGNYFIGAWADHINSVSESNETNNTAADAIAIAGAGNPDLVAAVLKVPAQAAPGQVINVVNVVKNQGDVAAGSFLIGFYLSSNDTISADDVFLGIRIVSSLSADASDSASTPLTIPSTTSTGTQFIAMEVDYSEAIDETNENNNTQFQPLVISGQIDLTITALNAPAQGNPGQILAVSNTVKNQGTLSAANFVVGFLLSADSVITSNDRLLEVRSVNNLAGGKENAAITEVLIPANITPGSYYLGVWADYFQQVNESNENNNVVKQAVAIGNKADLIVTSLTLPVSASPGYSLNVMHTIKNTGAVPTPAFRVGYYLSTDNVIDASDLLIGSRTMNQLAVGAADSDHKVLTIPENVKVGTYYFGVWVDDQNAVEELADDNNIRTESLQIVTAVPVDLVVASFAAPTEVNAGESFMVENSVKNQGTQAAPAFRVGIYLSVDTLITSTDILVASRDINTLAVGTTSQASTPATVPTAIRSGKYFIGIWADNDNAIFETNESNNTALHLITVITKANQPPVAKAGGPYATPHNRFVRFDASASFDPDGDAMNFLWQFGDGTSGNGVTVTHFYTKDSLYTVILTVTDERGGIAQDTTTVRVFNRPPIAKANGPYVANRVTLLQFSSSGSSDPDDDPLEFSWDFGDFSTGIGPSPKHLYTELDTVKVVLTVKDGHGGQARDTTTVFVINLPPEARFTFTPQRPRTLSDTVRFDASASKDADGAIRFYIWDFGDGSKPDSSGPKNWHLYKSLGDFVARLRVVDNEGASDDTTAGFRVRLEDRSQRQKIPDHFTLAQNYPNPYGRPDGFSSDAASTRIGYSVPVSAWVSLKIYNSLGQTVRTLVAAQHAPGFYETVWDGRDDFGRGTPSGIYFYALESRGVRFIRKITVLR